MSDTPVIHKIKVQVTPDFSVQFCEKQDFSDFMERSNNIKNDVLTTELFQKFCYNELKQYLFAFKSPNKFRRILGRLFPDYYQNWLYKKAFSKRNLMFTLHTLRSEQNRETAIEGIKVLLRDFFK